MPEVKDLINVILSEGKCFELKQADFNMHVAFADSDTIAFRLCHNISAAT